VITVRGLLILCAVVCLVFAAFDLFRNDTVSWLILGLVFWQASRLEYVAEKRLGRKRA